MRELDCTDYLNGRLHKNRIRHKELYAQSRPGVYGPLQVQDGDYWSWARSSVSFLNSWPHHRCFLPFAADLLRIFAGSFYVHPVQEDILGLVNEFYGKDFEAFSITTLLVALHNLNYSKCIPCNSSRHAYSIVLLLRVVSKSNLGHWATAFLECVAFASMMLEY